VDVAERSSALRALADEASRCERCALSAGRTHVVFGSGDPGAALMLVGEAPGFHEDQQGQPFAGQTGTLLDRLLGEIGLERRDVYVVNVLKCRPPGNRDPQPDEIAACEPYLFRQVELVAPLVVATLGNFATRLLSGGSHGITRVRGRARPLTVGGHEVTLYPLYHPAAALYTPSMLAVLEQDFARLPELLATPLEPLHAPVAGAEALEADDLERMALEASGVQLGLF
jgi:DNA polymerase